MIVSPNTTLCNKGVRSSHVASVVAKEESMTFGDVAVSLRTLPSPEAFNIPQSRRPGQS